MRLPWLAHSDFGSPVSCWLFSGPCLRASGWGEPRFRAGSLAWLCFCCFLPQPYSAFFFLRLPIGQYGPVSQLSRSEERCTGPFNWGEAHCAGEKVKRKIGPFLRKSLKNQTRTRTQQKGAQPATATRNPLARLPGARAKEETNPTNKRLHQQILVRLNVLDLQWTIL